MSGNEGNGVAICTLFEGDYHYGVGALVNSLYRYGYRGVIWAGFRGKPPPWAYPLREDIGFSEYMVAEQYSIRFVHLHTTRHLTNYKPEFMLDICESLDKSVRSLFYFDPDIVIKCRWNFFEEWISCGVALCEDLNSPMPASHPIRHAWRKFAAENGMELGRNLDLYVNGGFIGLQREEFGLLHSWKRLIDIIEQEKGSLSTMAIERRPAALTIADQDALNMVAMLTGHRLSLIGKDGMDFVHGGYVMSHAAGSAKPWRKRYLRSALDSSPPTMSDKGYWSNVESPIRLYSGGTIRRKKYALKIGGIIGRLTRRG